MYVLQHTHQPVLSAIFGEQGVSSHRMAELDANSGKVFVLNDDKWWKCGYGAPQP